MLPPGVNDLREQARTRVVAVDLVELMTAPTVLRQEVITRGRRIHCIDRDVAVEFEGRSLAEHGRFMEDFAPLLAKVRESGRACSG